MRKVCIRCILDTSISQIYFDAQGVCNYCHFHDSLNHQYPLDQQGQRHLEQIINAIQRKGRRKDYDCIVGVSGGTDSTYTLYQVVNLGLRPLAVHLDNGWDAEIAVQNIKNAVQRLGVDLQTHVLDWEEFRKLQIAFLRASVPDLEIPTDYAIHAALYQAAARYGLHYVINGMCFRTEGNMPSGWSYGDACYINSVYKIFTGDKLKSYPQLALPHLFNYIFLKHIKIVRLLNYIDYHKEKAKNTLTRELGWQDYGGHHYESVYTRFFQSYISPVKFNMDRRKVSLSALVRSGQLTRLEAMGKMQAPPYPPEKIEEDREYITKKLGLTKKEFDEILALPGKTFQDYPTYYPLFRGTKHLLQFMAKWGIAPILYHKEKYSL